MNTALVVTADDALRARIERALARYSVFTAASDAEALRTLAVVDADLVVRDCGGTSRGLESFVVGLRRLAPGAILVALNAEEAEVADFVLGASFSPADLALVLRQAADKERLVRDVAALRAQLRARPASDVEAETHGEAATPARVLKEFTRAFAAGFDLPRVLEMFLDGIGEFVRPTRSALLLPDAGRTAYRIHAHRGVAPQIVGSVRLAADEGLPRWLAAQGRPARLQDLADPDVVRELQLVQGVLAVPLLAHGELVAILSLGQPVFGTGYARRETETLFDLATHLATAIRDITLHHELQRAKEFNERILAHMASGVITIGRDQKIGIMNRRAEEILEIAADTVVKQDLRALPSPLGDMLYATLVTGRSTPRAEVQLALRNLALEISTYPVHGAESEPLGAVLVFEDLTAQKELAAQKRQSEQFQLLARVVARIADEIKNPLVSINTFMELIEERYDDPDFRKHFSSVVGRDVRRLVEVFEKLAGLVSEGELNLAAVDARTVVEDVVAAVELADDALGKRVQLEVERGPSPQMVRTDAPHLRKALSYLVWYLGHNSQGDQAKVAISITRADDADSAVRISVASRTATVPPEKLDRLFDPVHMVQESLIDVGPAVSQRLVEAIGGRLRVRQGRHDLAFQVTLPAAIG
ncbi:MAG TPA: GAF domain-containing protein [Methylomirabilota bacterium]|jgi:nitrogen-specific signal transduction histidine kinase